MVILQMKQIEKNEGNTIIFPTFDLDVRKGEIVAIKCHSEAGRQLIKMVIGEVPLSNGEILLEGVPLNRHFKSLSARIGIFQLDEALYDRLTPQEYLEFFQRLYGAKGKTEGLLDKVCLAEKAKVKIMKLSYSEKKRLQLAKAVLHQPDLLLMEEPDQNMNIESKIIMQRVLADFAERGKAVLITTDNFESAISMTNTLYQLNEKGLKKIEVVEEEHKESAGTENQLAAAQEELPDEENLSFADRQIKVEKIPAKMNEKIVLFDPTEIIFVESNEGVAQLHVNGEVFPCSATLNELSERLQPFGFFRCHRSYIVNLQRVREVIPWTRNSYSLILEDSKKTAIPLSKGKLNELKNIMGI
ncbi:LytTR family transcriptional regulator DNA-binding domain-containing protein [Pseudobacillus badius]|uniref:LytTR family transcriptional regulator DNA-binding domain-containing protein n=1 Tax=Bacillus badius TaxID=1455 RepID=UPI0007B0B66A|nr:LytTR family transcriptional regulator DNA-binding domain-containing protein [Bacillus badius]KZO01316.1 transcriptional regulator [Bacillus badius]MED0665166.1 LytTR family transcriptional regulator DNA-binding domain-containing protein [Bacillus badius]OCS89554.1 transcriptional regulator [Bacillus badius]OVE49980.1 transcriptional regulator [Bacillus badius]TDW01126.1 LytTR family transcriptional regulator [Bacillus badius]